MTRETPEQTLRRLGDQTDADIRDTIASIYAPMQRQASDGAALVAIALFCSVVAILARLWIE